MTAAQEQDEKRRGKDKGNKNPNATTPGQLSSGEGYRIREGDSLPADVQDIFDLNNQAMTDETPGKRETKANEPKPPVGYVRLDPDLFAGELWKSLFATSQEPDDYDLDGRWRPEQVFDQPIDRVFRRRGEAVRGLADEGITTMADLFQTGQQNPAVMAHLQDIQAVLPAYRQWLAVTSHARLIQDMFRQPTIHQIRVPAEPAPIPPDLELELIAQVESILDTMNPNHALALRKRRGLTDGFMLTLDEARGHLGKYQQGVTVERVRQLEWSGMRKLHHRGNTLLRQYLTYAPSSVAAQYFDTTLGANLPYAIEFLDPSSLSEGARLLLSDVNVFNYNHTRINPVAFFAADATQVDPQVVQEILTRLGSQQEAVVFDQMVDIIDDRPYLESRFGSLGLGIDTVRQLAHTGVAELHLDTKIERALYRAGIDTLADLLLRRGNLMSIRNLGGPSIQKIIGALDDYLTQLNDPTTRHNDL